MLSNQVLGTNILHLEWHQYGLLDNTVVYPIISENYLSLFEYIYISRIIPSTSYGNL